MVSVQGLGRVCSSGMVGNRGVDTGVSVVGSGDGGSDCNVADISASGDFVPAIFSQRQNLWGQIFGRESL